MSPDLLILAAEEEKSGLFLILPDPAELVWGAVSFVVIVFLIWKFAMPALDRTLEARRSAGLPVGRGRAGQGSGGATARKPSARIGRSRPGSGPDLGVGPLGRRSPPPGGNRPRRG